jgi:hypothetical protein
MPGWHEGQLGAATQAAALWPAVAHATLQPAAAEGPPPLPAPAAVPLPAMAWAAQFELPRPEAGLPGQLVAQAWPPQPTSANVGSYTEAEVAAAIEAVMQQPWQQERQPHQGGAS